MKSPGDSEYGCGRESKGRNAGAGSPPEEIDQPEQARGSRQGKDELLEKFEVGSK